MIRESLPEVGKWGHSEPVLRCDPSVFMNASNTMALQLGWSFVKLRDQILYSPHFFVLLESMLLIEKLAVFRIVYSNIYHKIGRASCRERV